MKLSIIIPAYNEAETIEKVISDLKNELANLILENYEIIVVDDGSKDQTFNILKTIGDIKVLSHKNNIGYGASLKTGIKHSQYDLIMIIDADGTYPASAMPELLKKTEDFDLVIGSREKKGNAIPKERKHAKKFLNWFAGYLSGKNIPDLNSGLRIFKKEIVLKYWELFPDKFSFSSTTTMVAITHGYDTVFVPIDYYKRKSKSSLRASSFFNFLKLVTKLSLFFRPIKVFAPISLFFLFLALFLLIGFITNIFSRFLDTTFVILCATALQTFFFGLLAEIIIHNSR
jgi:glycosyltransferase involved in cell wall biosynthesis